MQPTTTAERSFQIFNQILMVFLALVCLVPLLHVLALSLSSSASVMSNQVTFWPIGLNFNSYEKALENPTFLPALGLSAKRTILSLAVSLLVNCLAAYVLSKGGGRDGIAGYKGFVGFFIVAMLFNGGMIPTYLLVTKIGLYNSIWALILPSAVNVFYLILIMNFFKALPKELEEAAFMDGANHWQVFARMFLPLSLPVLATVGLFMVVNDWNEWFMGSIYMKGDNVPLSTLLKSIISVPIVDASNASEVAKLNNRSIRAAQVLIGALPILLIYPVLQRFFTQGIVIGAVKE
ncbi:carbohydrate ABC transporter permease [Cohnella thailandensis]|uniref:Carbohydrate ABC transporter permease n=1 Tax=Cohnella thailandensis TaxID=557557 RepID=A0A841SYF0_9BACL|nr:carbohydrate ABC transporter permease [Cohnella thailandensis]MBB6634627.1 carbohydrate ABC transporter permease [Cohnella thailandensis]MBP1972817.1 putative aldouronate transport system permease protein [Cohnella thailandensis]